MTVKSPAFQFYPDDFLGSGKVGTMTTEEVGAFTLLLCLDWNETGFVYDEEELSRWCRLSRSAFRRAWRRVSRCFKERDGRLFNPRLEVERTKQAEWREKSKKGGVASGKARGKQSRTTDEPQFDESDALVQRVVQPPYQPNGNTPSPSPLTTKDLSNNRDLSTVESPKKNSHMAPSAIFEKAWSVYPSRAGSNPRRGAESAWRARVAEGVDELDMLAGTTRYRAYCEARGNIGTEYVQQAKRFYGPSREFENAWIVPAAADDSLEARAAAVIAEEDAREHASELLLASRGVR